jgi:hypothetical protein
MGKYSTVRKKEIPKSTGPHYAWRGIGCLMMILVPAISFAAGVETIKIGLEQGWPIPYELLGTPQLPAVFYQSTGLMTIFGPMLKIQNFYAYAVTGLLYTVFLGGIISIVYTLMYRIVAPVKRNPLDVERPNIKVKQYKR